MAFRSSLDVDTRMVRAR